ncbi:MAG: ATP synthase F1 subunit gamma [Azospirillum sp.]|nr:MAG: ATP synthase F1 subunit gamma [Azospirillum sp.]
MAGLKELRTRIETIKSTQKITSAMKMVAASSLRKAQGLIASSVPYRENILSPLENVVSEFRTLEQNGTFVKWPRMIAGSENDRTYLLLVFTSDRGLCGNFNASVAKVAARRIEELQNAGKEVKVACIGRKGYSILKRRYAANIVRDIDGIAKKGARYDESAVIANYAYDDFMMRNIDVCEAVYSEFHSAINREIVVKQLLPLRFSERAESGTEPVLVNGAAYEYEPYKMEVLGQSLPLLYKASVFEAIIHSQASEHGARMTSMDNATRNAKDMISRLTLKYNRMRQTNITTELIEIIAGAEAL